MKRLVIWLVAATACWSILLASGTAAASSIGVYFDQQATTVCVSQHPITLGTAYILAVLEGDDAADGIIGAEFRVDGMPASWFPTAVASPPLSSTVGNPFTGGCNIAFPCQASHIVLLYVVHYTVVSELTVHLSVQRHTTPSNPNLSCPWFDIGCLQPCDCFLCVPGSVAAINDPAFCLVGVEPSTWSWVKRLYER